MAASSPTAALGAVELYESSVLSRWPPFIKDSHHRAPHTSGRPPRDYFCNFPFPVRIFRHLGAHLSFLGLLAALPIVGRHPQASESCTCPASRLKKEPRVRNRDTHDVMDGGAYMSEARSWNCTLPPAADDMASTVEVLTPGGGGSYQL